MEPPHKDHINALGKSFIGGPNGLGDPEDMTMRHVESFVIVTAMVKDRAHLVKCHDLVQSKFVLFLKNIYGNIKSNHRLG
jgi:hypothetical protein